LFEEPGGAPIEGIGVAGAAGIDNDEVERDGCDQDGDGDEAVRAGVVEAAAQDREVALNQCEQGDRVDVLGLVRRHICHLGIDINVGECDEAGEQGEMELAKPSEGVDQGKPIVVWESHGASSRSSRKAFSRGED
jgi:hypothetical protein